MFTVNATYVLKSTWEKATAPTRDWNGDSPEVTLQQHGHLSKLSGSESGRADTLSPSSTATDRRHEPDLDLDDDDDFSDLDSLTSTPPPSDGHHDSHDHHDSPHEDDPRLLSPAPSNARAVSPSNAVTPINTLRLGAGPNT
ncbi:hypothetical protein BaRGS_00015240 [Batillaria attramentaria]|uniref:Uncharacterized protein n=1 Tax=Batillaria attramentaria TaxID=370345 RepID=A0ABD0L210_9CAEN